MNSNEKHDDCSSAWVGDGQRQPGQLYSLEGWKGSKGKVWQNQNLALAHSGQTPARFLSPCVALSHANGHWCCCRKLAGPCFQIEGLLSSRWENNSPNCSWRLNNAAANEVAWQGLSVGTLVNVVNGRVVSYCSYWVSLSIVSRDPQTGRLSVAWLTSRNQLLKNTAPFALNFES